MAGAYHAVGACSVFVAARNCFIASLLVYSRSETKKIIK